MTNITRRQIYRRDGWQCVTCGSTVGLQCHHYIPRSHGGKDVEQNLVTLCWKCHAIVHGVKIPEYPDYIDPEWMDVHIAEYMSEYYVCETNEPWCPRSGDPGYRSRDVDDWRTDDVTDERAKYLGQMGLRQVWPGKGGAYGG